MRSLDINPFSPVGVDERQVRFLICLWSGVLADAPEMSSDELLCTTNWNRVIPKDANRALTLGIGCETAQFRCRKWGKDLFHDLEARCQTMDSLYGGEAYQQVCDQLVECFDNPELTFSARILRSMIDQGIGGTGRALSAEYREMLMQEPFRRS